MRSYMHTVQDGLLRSMRDVVLEALKARDAEEHAEDQLADKVVDRLSSARSRKKSQ